MEAPTILSTHYKRYPGHPGPYTTHYKLFCSDRTRATCGELERNVDSIQKDRGEQRNTSAV
jgi:hypothetical protein